MARLLLIVIIVQLYRLFVLLNAQIDFYVDEVYYWTWSKDLAFGYYSKPPMIAWVIWLFTQICGDGFLCIKLPALLAYPLTTIFIYLIAKELFDERVAFWSGVAFITLPAVSLGSLIISTDALLLLFWSASLYFFIRALHTDRWRYWLAAAVAAGAGLLSKQTMILFILSVFGYLAISPAHRHHLKNPKLYLTALLAALIYLPNLVWNAQHDFITFTHTRQISKIDSASHFHIDRLLEFWGAQMVVFGPIFFPLFLYLLLRPLKDERFRLLYAFSLPFFAVISLQAFLSRALANWAAPTYVAATILVVGWLLYRHKENLLKIAIAINIAIALAFYHYHAILDLLHIQPTSRIDPFKRVRGFSQLAQELSPILQRYPNARLLFADRTTMAQMIYYLDPHPLDAAIFNPSGAIGNQYHITADLKDRPATEFLFIAREKYPNLQRYFQEVREVTTIEIPLYPDYKRTYYIYHLRRFKGYR